MRRGPPWHPRICLYLGPGLRGRFQSPSGPPWGSPGPSFGPPLGLPLAAFGLPWGSLGFLWGPLGVPWAPRGLPGGPPGDCPTVGHSGPPPRDLLSGGSPDGCNRPPGGWLRPLCGPRVPPLGRLGGAQGVLWAPPPWAPLGPSWALLGLPLGSLGAAWCFWFPRVCRPFGAVLGARFPGAPLRGPWGLVYFSFFRFK